ncbi:hypothetical protein [Legionella bononiensis]|uniref:Capsule polysaccharide biosynthesis protein n=1 Tax=Legionella bononiensis TaxID=2793102 RepID=A0ABS1W8A4_9GAMM|nr:hypothetical protein [Legionella bononiensis]MBL7480021.1 hypothetical protein [Legionella bononiensis]MBL7525465.1 hypothetical protein [Legionella bononiensis]MBL7561648.1 hypothetical protein [Legionella bononiensis]
MLTSKREAGHTTKQGRTSPHEYIKNKEILYFDYKTGLLTDKNGITYTPNEINNQLDDGLIDFDIREQARKYIAELSNKVFKTTGRPLFESLNYNGISAWWFLEIALHEPVFLKLRSQMLLKKLRINDEYFIYEHRDTLQPNILPTSLNELKGEFANIQKKSLRVWIKEIIFIKPKNLSQLIFNYISYKLKVFICNMIRIFSYLFLKPKDILIFFENENIRTHYNFSTRQLDDALTYAEGIIEKIHQSASRETMIVDRSNSCARKPLWKFKIYRMPKSSPYIIPKQFINVIEELYSYISPLLENEMPISLMLEILTIKIRQFNEYDQLISKLQTKILFTYNWEGVFRPLMAAAKINNVKIIGVQQALGPYSHALNHHETGYWTNSNKESLKFPIPDKFLVWGEFHKDQFVKNYGYPVDQVETAGYARLDKHYFAKTDKLKNRQKAATALGLNPNKRYVLFTVQYNVLNTCLVNKSDFESTLSELLKLADLYDFNIIIKPWSGDNITYLLEQASKRPDKIHFAPQNVIIPNSYLLLLSDLCISTFSSIVGEATLCENLCFLINYPESKSYFEAKHMSIYDKLAIKINSPTKLSSILTPFLCSEVMTKEKLNEFITHLRPIFGPCDGKSADRISRVVLDSLKTDCE